MPLAIAEASNELLARLEQANQADGVRSGIISAFLSDWGALPDDDVEFGASRLGIVMDELDWDDVTDREWRLGVLVSFLTELTDPQGRFE